MGTTTSNIGVVTATAVLMTDRTMASSAMTTVALVFNTTTITPITCKEPISQASKATAEVDSATNAEVAAVAKLEVEEEVGLLELTTRTTTALVAITISTRPAECPCHPQWWFLSSHKCSTFQCHRSITVCWTINKMPKRADPSLAMLCTLLSSMRSGTTRRLLASLQVWSSMKTLSTLLYCSRTRITWASPSAMPTTCSSLSPPLSELDWLILKDGVSRSQLNFLACEIVWQLQSERQECVCLYR